ncbi:MAG: TonB-dependent receptor [Saprospiraceae bacterium]|nr:TonB-dependent receptor [Saprospiraceae bacterium]
MPRFIIHILLTLCLAASADAQTASIDSDFEQLIEQLCSTYKVKIGYSAELVKMDIPEFSDADLENMSVTELLDYFFSKEGLSYRMVDGDKILLRKDDVQLYRESLKTISGKIMDGETGLPLPYASIYTKRSTVGTMSDLNGQFSIEVQDIPSVELVVTYLGFKTRYLNISNLSPNEVIHLMPSEEILDEVTIIVDPMVIIDIGKDNEITLNKNRLVEVTAGDVYGSDILRSIQMLPGVSNDADAAGKIQLRGSDAEETLVMLDGIPLYKTDHYYGIFGAINPYYIEDATLYKNKIPLEYENRAGGMLMLNSTDYINNTHGNIELDFLKANAYVELPISSKVGLLIGGRFNHTDPFSSPLSENDDNVNLNDTPIDMVSFQRSKLIDVQPRFKFHDLNAKLKLDLTSKLSFSISTFGSSDEYLRSYDIRYVAENREGKKGLIDESTSDTEKWRNQGFNLSGSYSFQSDKTLKWSVFNSTYKNDYSLGLSLSRVFRVGEVEFFNYENVNYNEIGTGGIRLQYVKDDDWHIGVNLQNRRNEISIVEGSRTPINRVQEFGEGAIFGKKLLYPADGLEIGLGLRVNVLEAFDTMNVSPLIEMKYEPSPGYYLKASYAKLYQNFRELTFENRLGGYQQYFVLAQEGLYPLGFSNLFMVGGGLSI